MYSELYLDKYIRHKKHVIEKKKQIGRKCMYNNQKFHTKIQIIMNILLKIHYVKSKIT